MSPKDAIFLTPEFDYGTEPIEPPPAPLWTCACGWTGPSREMVIEPVFLAEAEVVCPKCRSGNVRMKRDTP